jgi:hypothetical protein
MRVLYVIEFVKSRRCDIVAGIGQNRSNNRTLNQTVCTEAKRKEQAGLSDQLLRQGGFFFSHPQG